VSRILGPNFTFDLQKYKDYSPLFLAPTFALNYALSFAALTASIVHIAIFHGGEVWYRLKAARKQEPDIHMRLMSKYKEAPDWWYGVLLVASTALGLATALGYTSQLPCESLSSMTIVVTRRLLTISGWAYFVAIILAAIFIVSWLCQILTACYLTRSIDPDKYDFGRHKYSTV
jgi:hypothetical protein